MEPKPVIESKEGPQYYVEHFYAGYKQIYCSSDLAPYASLAPSTHSSGGKTHYRPIRKQGSKYLRWMLNQVNMDEHKKWA